MTRVWKHTPVLRERELVSDLRRNRRGAIDWRERRGGQALLGVTFIRFGFGAALHPGTRVDKASAFGLPNTEVAVRGNGVAMMAGGAALSLDKLPRLAALGLIASMIPTTLAGHTFWDFDGDERKAHEIQFLKNAGLVGGLLLVLARSYSRDTDDAATRPDPCGDRAGRR